MDMHYDGVIYQGYAMELARRLQHSHPPFQIIDVRDDDARSTGSIPGSVGLQPGELQDALPQGTTPTTEFFIVGDGPLDERVRQMTLELRERGALRCVEISGGMIEWRQSGL